MHKKTRSKVADWLESYAREPLQATTCIHQHGPRKGQINVNRLADRVGLQQPTLQRILRGGQEPDTATVERIHEKTGRSVAEIRGVVGHQIDLELTPTAKHFAARFDDLPDAAKIFTADMMNNVLEFQLQHPALAKLMFGTSNQKDMRRVNRGIEKWQATHRTREKLTEDDDE